MRERERKRAREREGEEARTRRRKRKREGGRESESAQERIRERERKREPRRTKRSGDGGSIPSVFPRAPPRVLRSVSTRNRERGEASIFADPLSRDPLFSVSRDNREDVRGRRIRKTEAEKPSGTRS